MHALTTTLPSRNPAPSLYGLHFAELQSLLGNHERTRQLWRALYRPPGRSVWDRQDFSSALRDFMDRWPEKECPLRIQDGDVIHSTDGWTRRFLSTLADHQQVETVLMGYPGRFTACLSTQAGCAMGCVFCATGRLGFKRHLSSGEIVAQVVRMREILATEGDFHLRNLVLMGMGEPLHNYDNVMRALEIITDTRGINIGPSRITVSTVGVVPAIRRWIEEARPYHLAVSLHAATQAEREQLVPVARTWPLDSLMAACRDYSRILDRKVFFEWTLIRDQNDSPRQARQVAALLEGMAAHVNLIPLNPTQGYSGEAGTTSAAEIFQEILREAGIPSTVRQKRGIDVGAGCGQLRASREEAVAS